MVANRSSIRAPDHARVALTVEYCKCAPSSLAFGKSPSRPPDASTEGDWIVGIKAIIGVGAGGFERRPYCSSNETALQGYYFALPSKFGKP